MLKACAIVRHGVRLAALGAALVVIASACRSLPGSPSRVVVRFASGTPGAGFHVLGDGLAREYERVLPSLHVVLQESDGAATNIEAIQRGDADIGLSHADVTYLAFVGQAEGSRQPFGRLRGIAMLQLTRVHVVVRRDAGIHRIEELRGRRISLGRPGHGSASTAGLVLRAYGIELRDVQVEPLRYDEAAARLVNGTLDALLVTGTYPLRAVTVATQAGAVLLPLDGPPIERLRRDYPFFSRTMIPGGIYAGQPTSLRTIGVDSLLVCRADLDEALVHDLTQHLFEILPALSSSELSLTAMDLDRASATPIPLHDGAARYYRERELSR